MKYYAIVITVSLFFTSCLKESIPEAMLNKKNGPKVTATVSYKLNGALVSRSIEDVRNQSMVPYPTFACQKKPGRYEIFAMLDAGGLGIEAFTDTLTVRNYTYTIADVGQRHVLDYYNQSEFLTASTDRVSVNITSHNKGYISGNFSAVLTPMVDGNIPYTFGTRGSILITEGTFTNIPVFY